MYKIVFTSRAQDNLERFIDSYKSLFFQLFLDTGLSSEGLILENYRLTSQNIKQNIIEKIQKYFSLEKILGRRSSGKGYSFILSERSFLIIIDYTEDEESKTRYIENIIFAKK